jgi:prolyl-tRNA synthetase
MVHADDDGLVLPPKIAPQQVVILPISRGEENAELIAFCQKIEADLRKKGIRVKLDNSDAKTPDKMWRTIKQGVPVRVEIGQREMDEGKLTFVPRDLGRDGKQLVDADQFVDDIESILDRIQQSIFDRAKTRMLGHIKTTESLAELRQIFEAGEAVQVLIPTDLTKEPEYEAIQNDFSVTSRCMPFAENGEKVLVGKAY